MANDTRALTNEIAKKNAIYAAMASNCYHEAQKPRFPIERLGWNLVDRHGSLTDKPSKEGALTGLAYDIYRKDNSNNAVIAFRGTDSKKDWILSNLAVPFSLPYKSAVKAVRKYRDQNSNHNLVLVGHSLGGGLALSASVHQGVPAITFDPTPRIFDGLRDQHLPAFRVIIFQNGEFLARFREQLIHKAYDVVKEEDIYECHYDFGGENAHRIDILAKKIIEQASDADQGLLQLLE